MTRHLDDLVLRIIAESLGKSETNLLTYLTIFACQKARLSQNRAKVYESCDFPLQVSDQ